MNNSLYYKRCDEIVSGYIDNLKDNSVRDLIDGNFALAMEYLFLDKDDKDKKRLREEIILSIDYKRYVEVRDLILIIKNASKEDYERELFLGYSISTYSKSEILKITSYLKSCLEKKIEELSIK